ncbi:MAG: FAD-dependent oxidoreductase [Crocinitomicaceae bacterium]|nr:FAD-dependent oxidoreductase [Crocinitomicaceae bacterium]
MKHIVIIGNGISGITAARYIRKNSDAQITIISAESQYFFSRTALMYVFMGQVRFEDTYPYDQDFYRKNRLNLVFDRVESIDFSAKTLKLKATDSIVYDELILATGSKPRKLNIEGEKLEGIQGLYSKQDLEKLENKRNQIQKAIVLGGGLIGVELVEMLHYQRAEVDFVVRESGFWAEVLCEKEQRFIEEHIQSKGIRIHFNEEIRSFEGEGKVCQAFTKSGKKIEIDFAGITIGVEPNIEFLKNSELELQEGILVDEDFQTNIPNVYAIGDCAEHRNPIQNRKKIEQLWYTGKLQGKQLGENLGKGESQKYEPGPWFNSAKFFDIEFQNYGFVSNTKKEGQSEFIWKKGNKMFRLLFDSNTDEFIGINAFNLKFRHPVFDHWLRNKAGVEEVLQNLKTASFDGEFSKKYEEEIVRAFNQEIGRNVQLKKKMWYQKLISK